ncbi:hypothetical protein BAY61_24365 [Prauserella marina]|uniref:Integral membrane protein n=1 Tax=Prauserella marina TaxID=530584 RepID=A0A222W0D3_9PSEU|nr:DUF3817 domain-containing protein [Prauserella marina]ASR39615.1 hypothetical protein BAY61_24365 [Prauserella marina]PWV75533.1 integral membrane protein [Prauserella marina]SDD32458.1 integral membrane protein [Prauserella marina]
MSNKAAVLFRVVAVAEAFSWAGLLVGMFLKYVVGAGEGGVPVLGMVHGAMFVLYIGVTLAVFRPLRWSAKTVIVGLLAAIPPFFTWIFENWALRRGKLDGPQRLTNGGTGLFLSEPEPARV